MNLPTYYTALFNRITDAIAAIDRLNIGLARDILVKAQQEAEDAFLEEGGEEELLEEQPIEEE